MKTRNAKWFFALVLLVAVATVKAAPTIGDTDAKLVAHSVSLSSPADSHSADQVRLISGTCDSALANIATDFLKPPADFKNLAVLPPGTKSLPAVPAALFMGLTGFICVSLVRDRKVWLAVATTILWAGQVGFTALPQAASHLISRTQIGQNSQQQNYSSVLKGRSSRLRSDIEGTEYIGLLHYLEGIPATVRNTQACPERSRGNAIRNLALERSEGTKYEQRTTNYAPQFAIIGQLFYLPQVTNCLVKIAKQLTCFSPASIFESLPRGPPQISLS